MLPSEDRHGRRRRKGKERRKARGGGGVGGGLAVSGAVAGDVWCACTPGIPFAAKAPSVDCVVAQHQTVGTGHRGETERRQREAWRSSDSQDHHAGAHMFCCLQRRRDQAGVDEDLY